MNTSAFNCIAGTTLLGFARMLAMRRDRCTKRDDVTQVYTLGEAVARHLSSCHTRGRGEEGKGHRTTKNTRNTTNRERQGVHSAEASIGEIEAMKAG
ncbi:hypothetical protein BD311DRAFT_751930 [Dichomitus squalens]|uniref:Uncharacterized protein n=1 Tax=Dichomitus squalens TaxID=114155 RepID=A0A4Q9MVE3_9APHY|nr:hypothetical protein BD311DRAFT_751930 [Dichomitus squalens]